MYINTLKLAESYEICSNKNSKLLRISFPFGTCVYQYTPAGWVVEICSDKDSQLLKISLPFGTFVYQYTLAGWVLQDLFQQEFSTP